MSGQGDHFVQTDFCFASHFDRTCTLLMDLNLFIFFLFKLLCVNYAPGLNHRIIFNVLDMTPQTIDLTELIFFGWSVWPATVKRIFFLLPRLLSKDKTALVLYFIYIWPLLVVNYLVSEQTQAMQDCRMQPLIFGAFFFSLKGCGFHQWILRQNVLLSSSCILVTNIFHFRWVIEFFPLLL